MIQFLWETDAEHRLAAQHCPNLNDSGIAYHHDRVMGLRRWEIPGVDSKDRKLKAIMDRHKPLRDFAFRHTDDTGKFTGYRGTGSATRIETKASMAGHGLEKSG